MNYAEKLKIANAYLMRHAGIGWNDLPDINSLHDVEAEEDIHSLCDDRLEDSGFPMDLLTVNEDER